MSDTDSQARVLRYTARIVAAQASRNSTTPEALVALIKSVHSSLVAALSPEQAQSAGSRLLAGDTAQGRHGQGRNGQGRDGQGGSTSSHGGRTAESGKLVPAVPIKRSIHRDYLISLEDGAKVKMLKRHLATSYGLTPEQYRAKWGLPPDYPMVAPAYAERRSVLAKEIGLGRKRKVAPEPEAPAPLDDATPATREAAPAAVAPHAVVQPAAAVQYPVEDTPEPVATRHTAESVFANFRAPAGEPSEDDDEPEAASVKLPEGSKRKRFAQQPARRMPRKRTP